MPPHLHHDDVQFDALFGFTAEEVGASVALDLLEGGQYGSEKCLR